MERYFHRSLIEAELPLAQEAITQTRPHKFFRKESLFNRYGLVPNMVRCLQNKIDKGLSP